MPYIGGVGAYRQICNDVAAKGYEGFVMERAEQPRKVAAILAPVIARSEAKQSIFPRQR